MIAALCLSGHLRTWDETFPGLDEFILQPLQPDVFIHTWDQRWSDVGVHEDVKDGQQNEHAEELAEKVRVRLRPQAMVMEAQPVFAPPRLAKGMLAPPRMAGTRSMYVSWQKADMLRQDHEQRRATWDRTGRYDLVIRCRFDLLHRHHYAWPELLDGAMEYHTPTFSSWKKFGGVNELFGISDSLNMSYASSVAENLDDICRFVHDPISEVIFGLHCWRRFISVRQNDWNLGIARRGGKVTELYGHYE